MRTFYQPDDPAMIMLLPKSRYGEDLALVGLVADHLSRTDAFAKYHTEHSDNTHAAKLDALKGFRKWLLEQGFAIGTLNHRLSIIQAQRGRERACHYH
jgi:hypothetical protein